MKTRTLIFTLFISISILLIAQGLAFAGPITGCLKQLNGKLYNVKIGTEPLSSCSMGDVKLTWNGAPQFILRDSMGDQMGTVVTVNDDWESFLVGPPGAGVLVKTNRSVLTAIDIQKEDTTTATVAISVDRLNIRFQHRLLFEDLGCTVPVGESPLTKEFIVDVDFPPAFTMPAVVVGVPGQPNVRKLYVQTDEAEPPVTRNHFSLLIGSDCIDRPFEPIIVPSVSLELIDKKLHKTFPGPYTLEKL